MMAVYKEEILIDENYLKSLLEEINKAKYSIDMEVYIFDNDSVGQSVTDALCNAAKRGVEVRILVDGIGSINWGGKIKNQMEINGIKTKVFHPLPWKLSHWKSSTAFSKCIVKIFFLLSKINNRNHRKVCIIDKCIVFVGSANIHNYLLKHSATLNNWHETSVKLINIDVEEIQYAFDKAWGKISIKKRLHKAFRQISTHSVFLLNYSWKLRHKYYKSLLKRISHCNERIWVTNAYFVPDSHLLKQLSKASQRGVDVKIILPEKSDVSMEKIVAATFYAILLKNGVLIYEYTPTILHAKVLILDDWYSIGSSNLNYRSFKHDLEVNIDIQTDEAKEIIDSQFLSDLNQSRQLKLTEINNQSIFKRIIGRLLLLIRYWI
jgi:cardiolipin synthase A/B